VDQRLKKNEHQGVQVEIWNADSEASDILFKAKCFLCTCNLYSIVRGSDGAFERGCEKSVQEKAHHTLVHFARFKCFFEQQLIYDVLILLQYIAVREGCARKTRTRMHRK